MAANAQGIELSDEEKKFIAEHPVITATNELDWAPLDFIQNGEAEGFSIDYLNLVAEKVGLKIDYIGGYLWQDLLTMLENKEIDMAQSIIQTPDRSKYLIFTRPYLDMPMVFFGRTGSTRIETIDDLKNKIVGTVIGDLSHEILVNEYPEIKIAEYNDTVSALKDIAIGKIDLFVDIYPVTNHMLNQNMLTNISIVGDSFFLHDGDSDSISFAVRDDWPILKTILEKGMDAVTVSEFNALTEKWQTNVKDEVIAEYAIGLDLTEEEINWLSKNKIIKVATDPNNAPLEFIDQNGNISGLAGSYLSLFEEKLGITFEWSGSNNWTESLEHIHSKQAHMVSVVNNTIERREFLDFTDPILEASYMIFAREGGQLFGNLDALNGRTLAQIKDFSITEIISRDYPNINIIQTDDVTEALSLVATGQADAYVGSVPITAHHIALEGLTQISAVGETSYRSRNSMAARIDLPHLASALRKAMASISPLERTEISRAWLGIEFEQQENYELLIRSSIIAIVIIGLILIWNYSLQKEIRQRKAAELAAENASIAKTRFLANMSHELRTPLNAIIGFSDVILSGMAGEIKSQKQKEYLADIKNSGEHLATVINEILDLSKIEAGKWRLDITEFNLDDCITQSIKMIMPLANSKDINLKYEYQISNEYSQIQSDIHVIKRIIINLLSNAIKFTNEGGNIECNCFVKDEEKIFIEIKDNGIGIPEERIEQVLHPFEQGHESHNLNEEGTGLGLAIVNELATLIGGEIRMESEFGIGTTVQIILPLQKNL
ncbi:transporter substrate-binding domain-containing protein [Pseudemcibacter aquimaris]|uniref:transporter substrate-binding domain-containing protein n=1 Tax=Pseudemcibacter aquimaris TaxID=2857064 RepID=UPI00201203D6|nr:transporter substrate-binding domain-containing protein [Pseudemcibacter aquimaris]MCC3860921.1 transporter substrate-binding domain-containing protein [Pseudemcibacter aquimaris]WDU59740.1 transporter substrate-binding domain-containing protein [Pseudemcibacter aquimaris]